MPIDENELATLVRDGFVGVNTQISKVAGETEGRLKVLEHTVHELTIRVGPVLKAFENDLTTRLKLVENWIETDGLRLTQESNSTKNKLIGLMLGVIGTLILGFVSLAWSGLKQ